MSCRRRSASHQAHFRPNAASLVFRQSLGDWQRHGWIKHQTSPQEVADLLALAERDLKDCRAKGLSDDWKFNIAYNAALQASNAALVASGYTVAKGESNHFRVINHWPTPSDWIYRASRRLTTVARNEA